MLKKQPLLSILLYLLLGIGSVAMLFPFVWMVSTSFKSDIQLYAWPPVWLPLPLQVDNYVKAFTKLPFGLWFGNTALVTILSVCGTLLSCTVAAYGFARYRAPGRTALFMIMISTMMIPWTVVMIPKFFLFTQIGWVNSFLPLTVPTFLGNAFYVFLLRQFFLTVPPDTEEAAKIDGAGVFSILWHVVLPVTVPVLITVAIFQFDAAWNDFLQPLIYLNKQELFTIALGMNFFNGQFEVQWNYLMAVACVAMLPTVILFFIGQKYFVQGIALTGMKG
ncbi:carbohydrate ABC transporter permease [Paenibacillus senegalimassiliensis]|uniref:carbohydrate ABC transporter permease n=1 Tax=Paenibacillus senegalimassiliensis TaxID=1737426 RepID=UPI00073EF79D|nr:carbohydrate ABC transporter permease [Paenibacillus senegalimassiliensis]